MALNVLIVDDSWIMRAMIARTLRLSGLPLGEVYEAADGRAGAAIVRDRHVDLVLTDLNMPVMDGDAMIAELRSDPLTADLPIIVVSSEASDERRELLRARNIAFVLKPFTREYLRDVILITLSLTDAGFADPAR